MPSVTETFVQAIFVLVTFVHIRNISAVTDPILPDFLDPIFTGLFLINFFYHIFLTKILVHQHLFKPCDPTFCGQFFYPHLFLNFVDPKNVVLKIIFNQNIVQSKTILDKKNCLNFVWTENFLDKRILGQKNGWNNNFDGF